MKTYQFEEITFWLSFIAYLLCRIAEVSDFVTKGLMFIVISFGISEIYFAFKEIKKRK